MLTRLAILSALILWLGGCNKQAGDEENQDNPNPSTTATPNGTTTPNNTTPNEEKTDGSYTLEIGTVQLRAGWQTQTVEVSVKKDDKPVEADHSISGTLTCQEESKAEGTTDAQGKVILSFAIKPSESETCEVRIDFDTGAGYRIAKEKKDMQVAGLRDLLQVANNGAFNFKGTAPQSYTISTANCGDNAGMVKWESDNVVTPLTKAGDLSDVYLYGNIANCEFYLDDEEVAKPAYNVFIRYLANLTRIAGHVHDKLRLLHGYTGARNTSIVLVVHAPNGDTRFTKTLQLDSEGRVVSEEIAGLALNDVAWVKHDTGLIRWVVSSTPLRCGLRCW